MSEGRRKILICPTTSPTNGLYVETQPCVIDEWAVDDEVFGQHVWETLLLFKESPDFGSGKGTDWPAYKASGLRTLWSFEEKFVRIIVECLPCILRLEGSVPTKDAKGLFVGRVIPIACEFEDLGAVLRLICRSARRLADEDYS